MNLELFIARKIRSGGMSGKKLAGPVIKIATLGVTLGMVVMLLSLSIGLGFKREIRQKIIGFGSHIQIMNYDYNQSYETNPIHNDTLLTNQVTLLPGVKHIQRFASKPGMIKTKEAIHGIVLKGVGPEFDWSFFQHIMVEGSILQLNDTTSSKGIIISRQLASLLNLSLGSDVRMYFLQKTIRARKYKVTGIYDSHFPEFDNLYAFVDIKQVQKLNSWESNQISGYEVSIEKFDDLTPTGTEVNYITSAHIGPGGSMLRTRTIQQLQPQIFGWLDLLDMNVLVILILIIVVAGFNMVSGLLILILERTNMIGIMKALGTSNWSLRKVFLYLAFFIVGRGLLWGNLIGITLCGIQKYTKLIKLDPANYYLDTVPIYLTPWHLVILNIAALIITLLMMIGPSYLAARISPAKAIRFE
ncbi:ABC transporter permease [Marinilabiliaceae bacterium JC017]|nr:ABC transporter permease [Marinilabiliaceae bacterium JC017]